MGIAEKQFFEHNVDKPRLGIAVIITLVLVSDYI